MFSFRLNTWKFSLLKQVATLVLPSFPAFSFRSSLVSKSKRTCAEEKARDVAGLSLVL